MQTLISFLGGNGFVPHGYCRGWRSARLWRLAPSDTRILLAHNSFPITPFYFVINCKELPYPQLFTVSGVLIGARGCVDLFSAISNSLYRQDDVVEAVTAVVSVGASIPRLPSIISQRGQ